MWIYKDDEEKKGIHGALEECHVIIFRYSRMYANWAVLSMKERSVEVVMRRVRDLFIRFVLTGVLKFTFDY